MRLLIIGGSDAGISAALRAQELDRDAKIDMLLADDFPNLHTMKDSFGMNDFLDLSYTPPLSSPWDPVQMAAHHWMSALRSEKTEEMCGK